MSQSPTAEVADPNKKYLDAWQDLAVRIQRGESFSGRERNCFFLNTKGQRFAEASAVANLDQIDDCRAVAVVDWDCDGDLDLIEANRTGPRIRYLENNFNSEPKSVALKLIGDPAQSCNRDAIGARVQVDIESNNGDSTTMTRTVYAGDAFVSQSSKWLHFGLPDNGNVTAVRVRWPGSSEWVRVDGLTSASRFKLDQASMRLSEANTRSPISLAADAENTDKVTTSESARVVMPQPQVVLPLKYSSLQTVDSTPEVVAKPGKVHAVVMWAPWCAPCLKELQELKQHAKDLTAANIELTAISVDSLSDSIATAREAAVAYQADAKLPFTLGIADDASIRRLNEVWQNAMYRKSKMPVPSTFLFDSDGRLRIVYSGQIRPAQLIDDANSLPTGDDQIRYAAIPLPGQWADPQFVTHAIAIASIYRDEMQFKDAEEYLNRFLTNNRLPSAGDASQQAKKTRFQVADVLRLLGEIAMDKRQADKALKLFARSLQANSSNPTTLADMAKCLKRMGRLPEAKRAMKDSLKLNAKQPGRWNDLGVMYLSTKETANAATCFERALKLDARAFSASNNLAWIRATAADASLRDGDQAVKLATSLAKGPGAKRADVLDTLAAALAENGDFKNAMAAAKRAMAMATEQGNSGLANRIQKRLKLYQANKPFHEN